MKTSFSMAALAAVAGMMISSAHAQWTVPNLHPAGATLSEGHGVGAGQQVGRDSVGAAGGASLRTGAAASWVDPSAFLPASSSGHSGASAAYSDGVKLFFVGDGFTAVTETDEPLLWTRPLPASPCNYDYSQNENADLTDAQILASGSCPI